MPPVKSPPKGKAPAKGKGGSLNKKVGPLPVKYWIVIVAGLALGYYFYKRKKTTAAATANTPAVADNTQQATQPPSGNDGSSNGNSGSGADTQSILQAIQDLATNLTGQAPPASYNFYGTAGGSTGQTPVQSSGGNTSTPTAAAPITETQPLPSFAPAPPAEPAPYVAPPDPFATSLGTAAVQTAETRAAPATSYVGPVGGPQLAGNYGEF